MVVGGIGVISVSSRVERSAIHLHGARHCFRHRASIHAFSEVLLSHLRNAVSPQVGSTSRAPFPAPCCTDTRGSNDSPHWLWWDLSSASCLTIESRRSNKAEPVVHLALFLCVASTVSLSKPPNPYLALTFGGRPAENPAHISSRIPSKRTSASFTGRTQVKRLPQKGANRGVRVFWQD